MVLDIYSKMLVFINFVALLLLVGHLDTHLMIIPYGILMVLQWIWLYKLFEPFRFGLLAIIAVITSVALYVPNDYIRTISIELVMPAVAAAVHSLLKADLDKDPKARGD